jgi:hypothetical protein
MKVIKNLPFFPVTLSTKPAPNGEGYVNDVVGGISARKGVALEIFSALLSNPAYVGAQNKITGEHFTAASLLMMAFNLADRFVEMPDENGDTDGEKLN